MSDWEAYAVRYATQEDRKRVSNFLFDDHFNEAHPIEFFVWVLRRGDEVILIDTGFDAGEAGARSFPIELDPGAALAPLGLKPEDINTVIVTHLHFDHAGGMHLFPNATLHMQAAEMAYATGPCMCHDALRRPFTAGHVCEAVKRLYAGKLVFHDGDGEIADGVTVHCIGGHSRGLQAVRVRTQSGYMVIASDTAHFYENYWLRKPFPIVVDMEDMLNGFDRLGRLASRPELIVPGHDPLVRAHFAPGPATHIVRLDTGPIRPLPFA